MLGLRLNLVKKEGPNEHSCGKFAKSSETFIPWRCFELLFHAQNSDETSRHQAPPAKVFCTYIVSGVLNFEWHWATGNYGLDNYNVMKKSKSEIICWICIEWL